MFKEIIINALNDNKNIKIEISNRTNPYELVSFIKEDDKLLVFETRDSIVYARLEMITNIRVSNKGGHLASLR